MNFLHASRAMVRAAQKHIAQANRAYGRNLVPVPRDQWPSEFDRSGVPVLACWRSRDYLVTAYDEKPPVIRLTVIWTTLRDDGSWRDGISWDELQRIKNECGYADLDAVELYPRQGDVVNVANLRHLWILPEPSPLAWRGQR